MAIRPGLKKYNWEIELTDTKSKRKYGLRIPQGSLQIGTVSQDDSVLIRNVGKRVGDFDEQRSWKGGRGAETLSESPESYWDSKDCWTLTPGHVHQTLQWYHARGLRSEDLFMPTYESGDVEFIPLIGVNKYIANTFNASSSYNAKQGFLWIRKKGHPDEATFRLMSDSAGSPNTALKTVTLGASSADYVSLYQLFGFSAVESLVSGTAYWVSVHGGANDDQDNHWEVGVNPDVSSGKVSSNGSAWSLASFALYYRVTDTDVNRRWFRFNLQEAFYIVDKKRDGTGSNIYLNGDRGKATAGSSNTLTDSTKAWVVNRFAGAMVRIISGTGSTNLPKRILSNTATALTIAGTWETSPAADSVYIIYATDWFTPITLTPSPGTLVVTSEPVVFNDVAYIPQGSSGGIVHMRWNSSTLVHDSFKETPAGTNGLADGLLIVSDNKDGMVIWRYNNSTGTGSGNASTVSRANLLVVSGAIAWNTPLTFAASMFTGTPSYLITNIARQENSIYVLREDGFGVIVNNRYNNLDTGIEKTPSRANGAMVLVHGKFLFYSWLHSVVRMFGATHDDIGDDYRGIGLPEGREGVYADGETYLKLVFFSIDAGASGTSSILAWDETGWHEILRSPRAAGPAGMVKMQVCPGSMNRLWSEFAGDLVAQPFPENKASPRLSSGSRFMHEGVLESASIDMGTASGLAKFIKELTAIVKNLNARGREVYVDIQTDENVQTQNWTPVNVMTRSPESTVFLGLQNVRQFAYRLRLCTNDNTVPIDVKGVIPNGYARAPFKMVFTMQVQAGGIFSRRGKVASSGELMRWLLDTARQPGRVRMDSVYEMAHNWYVIVHPPRQFPLVPKRGKVDETSNLTLTLQEA